MLTPSSAASARWVGSRSPGGEAAGEHVGDEPVEDLVGEGGAGEHRGMTLFQCSEQCKPRSVRNRAQMPSDRLPTVLLVPSPSEAKSDKHAPLLHRSAGCDSRHGRVGRQEARRQLLGELVRAWVDEIPEQELASHYAKALIDLDEHDLSMLAAWHASMECGTPVANREFLVNAFPALGEARREALKIAAGMRGEEAFNAGVAEEQALETVLPWLSRERCEELAAECLELYCWDRLGCEN